MDGDQSILWDGVQVLHCSVEQERGKGYVHDELKRYPDEAI